MTVTLAKLVRRDGSGISHKHTDVYEVYCTSPNDDQTDIDEFFRTGIDASKLPYWTVSYPTRSSTKDADSFCTNIRSGLVKKAKTDLKLPAPRDFGTVQYWVWETTCEFTPLGEYRIDHYYDQGTQGNALPVPTANPNEWQARYRFSFTRRQVDRLVGLYKGTFPYPANNQLQAGNVFSTPGLAVDSWYPVQNSARIQYDPPARGTEADLVMRIRNYTPGWFRSDPDNGGDQTALNFSYSPAVLFEKYIGRVNSLKVDHFDPEAGIGNTGSSGTEQNRHVWPAYTLKLESLNSNLIRLNNGWVYENDWEFHYRTGLEQFSGSTELPPLGWVNIHPDISRYERETETGKLCYKPIEVDGKPVYDGIRLDGSGNPIVIGTGNCDESFWLAFLAEKTADFMDFNQAGAVAFVRWDQTITDNPGVYPPP